MVVLITGGRGFLGRQIVQQARDVGHEVLSPTSVEMNLVDLASIGNYLRRNKKIDAIIHSAAYYGGIGINVHQPADLFYVNSIMALNVWQAAAERGISHVMSIGSACAYPGNLKGDFDEMDLEAGPCHDSVEGYGNTKRVHRICQRVYAKQYKMIGAQPVLTNLYGEHDDYTPYRSHVVAALIAKFCNAVSSGAQVVSCWGDGSPIREFIYVKDAAEAIVKCLDYPDAGPINIGTGVGTSIKQLVELLVSATGYKGKVEWDTSKPGGADRKVLNVEKAKNILKWTAKTGLGHGLMNTVNWYNSRSLDEQERAFIAGNK